MKKLTLGMQQLLAFIRGEGHHYGTGIMTKPLLSEEARKKHEDCLKLETMDLIYRHFDNDKVVVWLPKEAC